MLFSHGPKALIKKGLLSGAEIVIRTMIEAVEGGPAMTPMVMKITGVVKGHEI